VNTETFNGLPVMNPSFRPIYRDNEDIIELADQVGLSYIHSSGCAVMNDGTWLQPEEWQIWIDYLAADDASESMAS